MHFSLINRTILWHNSFRNYVFSICPNDAFPFIAQFLGLFHRAIAQSGSALNFWARGNKNGKELARNLGFASEHDEDILNFLEKVPVDKLYEAQEKLKEVSAHRLRYSFQLGQSGTHYKVHSWFLHFCVIELVDGH